MQTLNQPIVPKFNLLEEFDEKQLNSSAKETKCLINKIIKDEIWIVDNFFTAKQCKKLIEVSEKIGYQDAMVTTGMGLGILVIYFEIKS